MQNNSKRASIYLGVIMAVALIAGALAPLFRPTAAPVDTTAPTVTPLPTFPPPPADLNAITFDKLYLHPSGIFTVGQPDGWTASDPNKGPTIAQVNLINSTLQAVADSYIEAPGVPISAGELTDHFSEAAINSSWANFTSWQESSRHLDDDRLTIDFTVTLQGRTYVARQLAWTDGTWIYVVRVLVPENATDLLRYLLDNFVQSLKAQTEFRDTPFDWNAYYDPQASHIIRYPSEWSVTDSAPGRPTSISSTGGVLLRVESRPGSIADEAAARSFVEAERSGISVVSAVPVQRGLGQGFSVAYSHTTVDGSAESGLALLLNGPDGMLHIANLLFPASGIDLNSISLTPPAADATPEATADTSSLTYLPLAQVMSTFFVIEPLNLSTQSLPPTATPLPTLVPTTATTSEATSESTAEVTGEATPAAPESTSETTQEATAEATASS